MPPYRRTFPHITAVWLSRNAFCSADSGSTGSRRRSASHRPGARDGAPRSGRFAPCAHPTAPRPSSHDQPTEPASLCDHRNHAKHRGGQSRDQPAPQERHGLASRLRSRRRRDSGLGPPELCHRTVGQPCVGVVPPRCRPRVGPPRTPRRLAPTRKTTRLAF
jgi:hypothetical protein